MKLKSDRPIILINPLYRANWEYVQDNPAAVLPLGILSIGTLLSQNGYKVKIIDACTNPDYLHEIEESVKQLPLFIGISSMTAQIYSALQIADFIRKNNSNSRIPIVWGGIHPTIFPEHTARNPYVDIVAVGLAEYTCLELADRLISDQKDPQLDTINGLAFLRNNEYVQTSPREFIDINTLPFIDYDLIDIDKFIYRSWGYGDTSKKRSFILYTGVGCPFRCAFCANVALHKRRYSGKSPERILDEVDYFTKKYKAEYLSFCDELFFVNKKRIEEFLDGMLKRNIKVKWYGNIRADFFRPGVASEELIRKMKDAGCTRLGMGCESGSQRLLDEVIKKDIKIEYVLEAARLCNKYDITVGYSFMMGLPEESRQDSIKTIKLMKKIKKIHPHCFFFGPQVYIPFPGSELYKKAVELGYNEPADLDEWASVEINKSLQGKLTGEYLWNSFDPSRLPWVKHPDLIRHIDFLQNFLFRDLRTITFDWKWPFKFLLALLVRIRVAFNIWVIPFELWCYRLFTKILSKIQKA